MKIEPSLLSMMFFFIFKRMAACSPGQTNASLYNWGPHAGVEIVSVISYITGASAGTTADLTTMCVQPPYRECFSSLKLLTDFVASRFN